MVVSSENSTSGLDILAAQSAADIRFYAGGTTSGAERMRILANGNVGIGTTTPSAKFDVNGVIKGSSDIYVGSDIWLSKFGSSLGFGTGSVGVPIWTAGIAAGYNYNSISIPIGGAVFSGNVGIGTTAPDSILHLANVAPYITYEETDTAQKFFVGVDASQLFIRQGTTANADILSINSGGDIGIGTTAPSAKLHLQSSDGRAIAFASGTQSQQINFLHNDNGNVNARYVNITGGLLDGAPGANEGYLAFSTGPAGTSNPATVERMRIDSNGNVGIGTAAPDASLDVVGTVKVLGTRTMGLGINTIYQAATDGFVYAGCYAAASTQGSIGLLVGTSSPPSTGVAASYCFSDAGGNAQSSCTFTFPVKKGEYYRISANGNITSCTGLNSFTPMGR